MKLVFSKALPFLAMLGCAGVAHAATTQSASVLATVVTVPEPASLTLLGAGLAGLAVWKKVRK